MFSDNNTDILKYWKINPGIKKITNDQGTIVRIDETTWYDEEGNLVIRENWDNNITRDLKYLKGKFILLIGKKSSELLSSLPKRNVIIIGELEKVLYGPCSTKIIFKAENSIELEWAESFRLFENEKDCIFITDIEFKNVEGLGLEIKSLSEEEAEEMKNYLRNPNNHKIIKTWKYE